MFHIYQNSLISVEPAVKKTAGPTVDVQHLVAENAGDTVSRFIAKFGDPASAESLVVATSRGFNISVQPRWTYQFIVNLQRVNGVRKLCRFLGDVNRKLEDNGRFICCLETTQLRRQRIFSSFPFLIGRLYYFFDYLLNRVAPTIKPTRWLHRLFANEHNRPISYYEMVGRLACSGFVVETDEVINGRHYLVARKVGDPPKGMREHYGLILGLKRIGKDGRVFRAFKFRTMVAFSEYVQEQIYRRNRLCKGGKFNNDKRVTILGGFMRRYWLDEIPMLYNIFRGEMKLVGVRPVSPQYLSLYDEEVVKLRTSVKPGLIPPFYVDLPETLEEIQDSEVRYIQRWQKAPFRTDCVYFFKAVCNILFGGARSK